MSKGESLNPPRGPMAGPKDTFEAEAARILVRYGHLVVGASLPRALEEDALSGTLDVSGLRDTCEVIEIARHSKEPLYHGILGRAVLYGLKNLSGLNLSTQRLAHKDMRNFNLNDTNLTGTEFQLCDLSSATFRNSEFEHKY